jgi:hypothetical protein
MQQQQTALGSELHGVQLVVQSMDNLSYRMPRPAVFQCLCPGGIWLITFLHVVLRIRISGAVPPFSIRQADYITFHSEGSYDIMMTAHRSAVGLWEIKAFGKRSSAVTLRRHRALRPCPLHPFLFLYLPRSWRTAVFSRPDRKSACKQRSDLEGAPWGRAQGRVLLRDNNHYNYGGGTSIIVAS